MSKKQERKERLMPNGNPRYLKCFDKEGPIDRYTIVYTGRYKGRPLGIAEYLAMSETPKSFCQHGEMPSKNVTVAALGKKVNFESLPQICQDFVINEYCGIWKI